MILNASKISTAKTCWRKAFNSYVRFLSGEPGYGLIDGSATHAGIAAGMATKNWDKAKEVALEAFEKECASLDILPGEEAIKANNLQVVIAMIDKYKQAFEGETYTVLQPECRFSVEVPNSYHPDLFTHWIEVEDDGTLTEKWNELAFVPEEEKLKPDWRKNYRLDRMDPDKIMSGRVASPHPFSLHAYLNNDPYEVSLESCRCFMNHRLNGITDAVVSWHNNIWLLEHKTTSRGGPVYFDQYTIDLQITAYLWAIKKSLGVTPKGAIINALIKPSENQVASWNRRRSSGDFTAQKDYIHFEREPVFRTNEELQDFEEDLKDHGDQWILNALRGKFPKSNVKGICDAYMRMCRFKELCKSCDAPSVLIQLKEEAEAIKRRKYAQ